MYLECCFVTLEVVLYNFIVATTLMEHKDLYW